MDFPKEEKPEGLEDVIDSIPVLSSYARGLESHVKERYLKKISVVGVDPASLPGDQFSAECLPPIEVSDLRSYLVLETSYYTSKQFKAFKSLEAYNQMVSGFVTSVLGKEIANKFVVVAKVRHSQRMNDPLVNIWIITETDGTIFSAHCLGCKAGLAESCSHVASVLFYIEAITRIQGKLACTQSKCTWILPTYVKEVPYARVKDIDFSSAKMLKKTLDRQIDSLPQNAGEQSKLITTHETYDQKFAPHNAIPSDSEMQELYFKLNNCKIKPVALSLIEPYDKQFIDETRTLPAIPDMFKMENLDLKYPELLKMCCDFKLDVSNEHINKVENSTRGQANAAGFFRHRAGRIGASISSTAFHTNLAQPSQSLIRTICYPSLYKINNEATRYGKKHESDAIKTYEAIMKSTHTNLEVKNCGLYVNKQFSFLHATPDFIVSCDCCGMGCGEVKCPFLVKDCDFEQYLQHKNSCLEKVNGQFQLKKNHSNYYQVQQQLFTVPEYSKYCDFVVFAVDKKRQTHVLKQHIYPDVQHWNLAVPKLEAFWRICVLPEILGRWYTRRCTLPVKLPDKNVICFCRTNRDEEHIPCSNGDCPYKEFHPSCLSLTSAQVPKAWFCPHCSRLPQFKNRQRTASSSPVVIQEAMKCESICICNSKALTSDKLVECHSKCCENGKFFHLSCLGFKRMPNNHKTTWKCSVCKRPHSSDRVKADTTTCTSSLDPSSSDDESDTGSTSFLDPRSSDDESDTIITKVTQGDTNKTSALGNLTSTHFDIIRSPTGWLDCDIIQQAQVLLQTVNPSIEGFQRPTLGPVRNFDIVNGVFIQILHTGNSHWVCISSIGCMPGHVNLFDSLYCDSVINQEVEEQTNDMLGGQLVAIDTMPVQQQTNGSDCGVFAVAFSTCLVFGVDPIYVNFDIPGMRPHLIACLRDGTMKLFPSF